MLKCGIIYSHSIGEVFIDATKYFKLYKMNARQFAMVMIKDVLTTGITATAGIGTNLCLPRQLLQQLSMLLWMLSNWNKLKFLLILVVNSCN